MRLEYFENEQQIIDTFQRRYKELMPQSDRTVYRYCAARSTQRPTAASKI